MWFVMGRWQMSHLPPPPPPISKVLFPLGAATNIVPDSVMVEVVETPQGRQCAKTDGVTEEDLSSSIRPDLRRKHEKRKGAL